jgi:shikimate kinase
MAHDQIWLIGFMGTGKTRIARPLAAALGWQPLDTDLLIEKDAGETIPAIFERGGEPAFRALEAAVIARVAEQPNIVVATGGGAVLDDANRQAMRRRGFIVCLEARPETIAARVSDAGGDLSERPLLAGDGGLYRIGELKAQRQPLYNDADFIIQTDDLTPDQCTHQILIAFRERQAVGAGGAP